MEADDKTSGGPSLQASRPSLTDRSTTSAAFLTYHPAIGACVIKRDRGHKINNCISPRSLQERPPHRHSAVLILNCLTHGKKGCSDRKRQLECVLVACSTARPLFARFAGLIPTYLALSVCDDRFKRMQI